MSTQIIDLHGNILKPHSKKFKFWFEVPLESLSKLVYTRDRISDITFLLGKDSEDKYYWFGYNLSLDLYYSVRLDLIGYDESKDIRYEWKYGSKKH